MRPELFPILFPGLDSDALAWRAAVQAAGANVSNTQLNNVSTLVRSLKIGGAWSSLDRLWLFAAENSTQARRDLVARVAATPTNGPTFTANRGYAGDGLTALVDSNFNPTTAGGKYAQDDALFGAWVETGESSAVGGHEFVGVYATNFAYVGRNGANFEWAVNAGGNSNFAFASQTGLWSPQRTASNAQALFKDGASVASNATASAALENRNIAFLALTVGGSSPTDGRVAAGFIGKSMTAGQQTAFYNALRAYMTAVGVA